MDEQVGLTHLASHSTELGEQVALALHTYRQVINAALVLINLSVKTVVFFGRFTHIGTIEKNI
jgi:hypothetical protein